MKTTDTWVFYVQIAGKWDQVALDVGAVQRLGAEWRPTFPARPSPPQHLASIPAREKTCHLLLHRTFLSGGYKAKRPLISGLYNLQRSGSWSEVRSVPLFFLKPRQHDDMVNIFPPGEAGRGGKGCHLISFGRSRNLKSCVSFPFLARSRFASSCLFFTS